MAHVPGDREPLPKYRVNCGYYCLDCGYTLRGLENHTCPECGRPFDPEDSNTYTASPRSSLEIVSNKLIFGNGPLRLIEHLPLAQQQAVLESVKKSKNVRRVTYFFNAVLIAACIGTAVLLLNPDVVRKLALFVQPGFFIVMLTIFGFTTYFMRRAYGEELRRMNIRPAICPKCGYNLAAIDAARCPKCDHSLINET